MYNLSPRFQFRPIGETSENLGPERYTLCSGTSYTLKNLVPFLSSTERKINFANKLYTHALHDPNETVPRKIKGGSSVQNRSIRFACRESETPDPGHYNPEKPKHGCKYKPPPCHGKGNLYVCRVPYTLKGGGPSIPTHADENGYDIDDEENLIKVPPNVYDRSMGPAYYKIPREDFCLTTRLYKGCGWSRSNSRRFDSKIPNTPGPDYYNIKYKICKPCESDEEYRAMARVFTYLPRFLEGEMLRNSREGLPGPGQYDTTASSIKCHESLSIIPVPFITATKRFTSPKESSMSPGPGAYETKSGFETRTMSIKRVPFGTQARRVTSKEADNLPGPGLYETRHTGKCKKYSTEIAPFLKSAPRKIGFVASDSACLPGPGNYQISNIEVEEKCVDASCFKSRTSRFPTPPDNEEPEPPTYDSMAAFIKNRNRRSYNVKSRKLPFQSKQARQCKELEGKTENPGPTDYDPVVKAKDRGLYFNTTARFGDRGTPVPGPGYYWIHPSLSDSTYRAVSTYNLRLKENILRTKLRQSPAATQLQWLARLKQKKKLACFLKPPSREVSKQFFEFEI